MNRNLIIAICLILCLVASIIYRTYNKPHKDLSNIPADFKISASDWLKEFEENEESAQTKYLNKIVRVQGVLTEIQQVDQKIIWIIETGNPLANVQCEMDPRFIDLTKNITTGTTVNVQGICSGKLMDIVINQAVVVGR